MSRPGIRTPLRKIDTLIVHCAATKADMDIGSNEIDQWHRQQGWFRCGYHAVIRRDGTVETAATGHKPRPLSDVGSHVGGCGPGWNTRSLGVCMAGGIDRKGNPENNFTEAQFASLERVLREWLKLFPGAQIMGHRDLIKLTKAAPKACPSFDVLPWLASRGIPTPAPHR